MNQDNFDRTTRRGLVAGGLAIAGAAALVPAAAMAASRRAIERDADAALLRLYNQSPRARELGARARGMLIFPEITKVGFVVGGMGGDGALRVGGKTTGYFRIAAASVGFQAGAQTFSYVMFLITQSALDYLDRSDGWEIGAGPTLTLIDDGAAASLNTTNLTQDVYAMPFGQAGLMAGVSIEGSKITQINPRA